MKQAEATDLIKGGISGKSVQHWAELGCGNGTFTYALAQLLPASSQIIAVDKERQSFPANINKVSIEFVRADFINDALVLNNLDGMLMANSLHYVNDKTALLNKLAGDFRDEGRLVIVEYESRRANPWVPYPISFLQLTDLGVKLGYTVQKLSDLPSRFGGVMYSALMLKK